MPATAPLQDRHSRLGIRNHSPYHGCMVGVRAVNAMAQISHAVAGRPWANTQTLSTVIPPAANPILRYHMLPNMGSSHG